MSTKATSCPVTVYFQFLGGDVSLVLAGLQAQPVSTHHTYSWAFFVGLSCPCTPFTIGSAFPGVWNKRSPLTSVPMESLRTSTASATSSQPTSTSWH